MVESIGRCVHLSAHMLISG